MRDYQKQRVYNWEQKHVYPKMPRELLDISTMRVITNHVWSAIGMVCPPKVNINKAYKTKSTGNRSQILIMPGMNRQTVLIHEIAHSLNLREDATDRFDWHGPNYVADFVSLLVKFYGFDVWFLLATLERNRVDVNKALLFENLHKFG